MKLSSIVAVLTLAVWNSPAVLAQEWDMSPIAPTGVQVLQIESNAAPLTAQQPQLGLTTQEQVLQWDLEELREEELRCHNHHRGNTTQLTGQGYYAPSSNRTGNQRLNLPQATSACFGYVAGGRGGLPTTSMDSFVQNAGGRAETIYGDEGSDSIPPLFHFDVIDSGISGKTAAGLTTGQHQKLPSAWY